MRAGPILSITLAGLIGLGAAAGIIPEAEEHHASTSDLHAALSDPDTAEKALESVLRRSTALEELEVVALEGSDVSARGRAILAIQGIDGKRADAVLQTVLGSSAPPLVHSWAAAARINRAQDLDAFLPLAQTYIHQYPATARPIELKAGHLLADADLADMLGLMAVQPQLAAAIAPKVIAAPAADLVDLMQNHGDDQVRRQAAAYLASKAQASKEGHEQVSRAVRSSLAFAPKAKRLPWEGGALYVPGIQWKKSEALDLIRILIQWNLHLGKIEKVNEQRQVQNNLRSVQLLQAATFQNAWPTVGNHEVLVQYGQIEGRTAVQKLLAEQGLLESPWAQALDQLGKK